MRPRSVPRLVGFRCQSPPPRCARARARARRSPTGRARGPQRVAYRRIRRVSRPHPSDSREAAAAAAHLRRRSALFRSLLDSRLRAGRRWAADRGRALRDLEVIAVAMLRESQADLHEARRCAERRDRHHRLRSGKRSAIPAVNPYTRISAAPPGTWRTGLPSSSANHLISAADAFVAAHLWNVPRRKCTARRRASRPRSPRRSNGERPRRRRAHRRLRLRDSAGSPSCTRLRTQLPQSASMYFGDTARVPYGPKSPRHRRRYSREIARIADRAGREGDRRRLQHRARRTRSPCSANRARLPVIGVIEPGARAAARATRARADRRDRHRRHDRAPAPTCAPSTRCAPTRRSCRAACPLFVPLVEEGWTDPPATR